LPKDKQKLSADENSNFYLLISKEITHGNRSKEDLSYAKGYFPGCLAGESVKVLQWEYLLGPSMQRLKDSPTAICFFGSDKNAL
jgi:hypothetical protein